MPAKKRSRIRAILLVATAITLPASPPAAAMTTTHHRTSRHRNRPPLSSAPIKDYLIDHTEKLQGKTTEMRADAERYHAMAKAAGFDYEQMLEDNRDQVRAFVEKAQKDFGAANPAYEEMEGVVAGVPELAEYDVIIDAGSDASDPENAVPFNVTTPAGKTYKQPGNINYLIETSVFGTEPKFAAKGVEPDLDGDGKAEFGESVPDADFYVAAAREFERNARALRRRRAEVAAHQGRRLHVAGGDGADDVGVLRGLEELTLRGRREVEGEGVRRRLAAAGHRRHPRRPGAGLRQRRA